MALAQAGNRRVPEPTAAPRCSDAGVRREAAAVGEGLDGGLSCVEKRAEGWG